MTRSHCKKCGLLLLNDRERRDELCRFCKEKEEQKKRAEHQRRISGERY